MKQQKRQLPWKKLICLGLMLVTMAGILMIGWNEINTFQMVNNDSLHYVKGYVESVDSEQLEPDTLEADRQVGIQQLTVKILEGTEKGQIVSVTNYVTRTLNVVAKQGMTIVICVDQPEQAEPYYTVFNYYRVPWIVFTVAIFAVIVLAVGRGKGGWSLLGLGYTVFIILFFLVQAMFHGWSAMGSMVATIAVSTFAALILLGGIGRKTFAATAATLLGTALSGVLFWLFSRVLHISGYNLESAEALLMITQSTGMELRPMLMASVLIASLGAVMDVGMSVAASLEEIHVLNPSLGAKALMGSGMRIGKDMIGTMTNTLILAYTGTALTTMILLLAYGYDMGHLLNSDYLAMELSQGIASTGGVVLTVPVASAISALVYTRKKTEKTAASD